MFIAACKGIFLGFDLESGGCKIKVGRISSRSEKKKFSAPPPKWGANTTPWGVQIFDIDLKNPGIALQANSLRGDVCAL